MEEKAPIEGKELRAKVIIEILGAPEKHVKDTLVKVIEKIKEGKTLQVEKEKLFDTKQMEGKKLWSTFCELEMKMKDMQTMINFCFDFMPSSIELLEPKNLPMDIETLSEFMNDLISRLHQYDMLLKNMHAENMVLKKRLEDPEEKKK